MSAPEDTTDPTEAMAARMLPISAALNARGIPPDSLHTMSDEELAAHDLAAISATRAVLKLGLDRPDLYAAACEVARHYREEIERRTQAITDRGDQRALDRLNAALREACLP